jgi:hypothetical protein
MRSGATLGNAAALCESALWDGSLWHGALWDGALWDGAIDIETVARGWEIFG